MVLAALVVTGVVVGPAAAPASAADALLASKRTLFMTERFTASSIRSAISGEQPENVMALRGESEGFQLAVRNTTGATIRLDARITGADADLTTAMANGKITAEFLRVGFVSLPKGSTGTGRPAGLYADPLPPMRPSAGSSGLLSIASGAWGGAAVIFHVRTDALADVHSGSLELYAPGVTDTVYARVPFTLDVRSAFSRSGSAAALQQPGAKGAMKTILGVEGEAYWLAHDAMRNGPSAGYPTHPNRMGQLVGLLSFLGDHGVTPLNFPLANPSSSASYTGCGYDSPPTGGDFGLVRYSTQLSRYLAVTRALQPGVKAFPVRMVPDNTTGCIPESEADDFEPTYDARRTPSVKQDDLLKSSAKTFWTRVYGSWNTAKWFSSAANTYIMNPYDEPGDSDAPQRYTMNTQVPAANAAIRSAMHGKARVVLAGWPRDNRRSKACKRISGKLDCVTVQRDTYSNRKMWDGVGLDDVQVWMPPFSRLFGRVNNPVLLKHGYNRNTEYSKRLASIRASKGRETWSYNFFTGTTKMPQLTIDAPGTDSRLQYWMLAREGHTGLFVSNLMMGWGAAVKTHSGTSLRRKGNPFDQALYFKHNTYGYAAGWGTFIYPPYRPQLGISTEADRNSSDSRPVTSLRMEGLRDGQEDANLAFMYRARFGAGALATRMRKIFPGAYVTLPASLGNAVFPKYSNTGMAQRMETQRRIMIRALGTAP